jgi:hypothetical protein
VQIAHRAEFDDCVFEKPLRLTGAPATAEGSNVPPGLILQRCSLPAMTLQPFVPYQSPTDDHARGTAAASEDTLALDAVVLHDLRVTGDMLWRKLRIARAALPLAEIEAGGAGDGADTPRREEAPALRRVDVQGRWLLQRVAWSQGLTGDAVSVAGGLTLASCAWDSELRCARLHVQGTGMRVFLDREAGAALALPGAQLSAFEAFGKTLPVLDLQGAQIGRLDLGTVRKVDLQGARIATLADDGPTEDDPRSRASALAGFLMQQCRPDPVSGESITAALVARGDLELATEFAIELRHRRLQAEAPILARSTGRAGFDRLVQVLDHGGRRGLGAVSRFGFDPWRPLVGIIVLLVGGALFLWALGHACAWYPESGHRPTAGPGSLFDAAAALLPFIGSQPTPAWARNSGACAALFHGTALMLRLCGVILLGLAVLGFAGVLRPKGPRP